MSTRKANDDSHFLFVPLTQKSRDILNTTLREPTDKKHSCDAFVSSYSLCGFSAPLHHFTALCTRACKVFDFEHVNKTDNLTLIINSDSVALDPLSRSGVTAADAPPPAPVAAAASNSVSRPSLATGMSCDPANPGGDHEAVTAFSSEHERFCIEIETGTSPGACGTERERVGAADPDPVNHPSIPPTPETAAGASASPLFSSADTGMAGFDIDVEYELAALEQQWARDGIIMKASTFLVEFASEIIPASSA